MTKRTKRYGGFLVGDRVYYGTGFMKICGKVVDLRHGRIIVTFHSNPYEVFSFAPNELINLTRQEEERVITFSPSDLPDTPLNML